MSAPFPKISIVVPSFNQAPFVGEALQSIVDQEYPNLEVVVQDNCSDDGTLEILSDYARRYSGIFKIFVEKDSGHCQALNRGFARTDGEIMGFLNSDDTLLPGCLLQVSREIDPRKGRHVVFGRCRFTGTGSPYVGLEHPAHFESHFDHLAIWRRGFNSIPQPSTFWHRAVWRKCGGFDEKFGKIADYAIFCRFSRHFHFHKVDRMWSTYRMHPASFSSRMSEREYLALSIKASRLHWGSWLRPLRWRLEISHWIYQGENHEHARHFARLAEEAWGKGRRVRATALFFRVVYYSPRMAWHRTLTPALANLGLQCLQAALFRAKAEAHFDGKYGDGWIGPVFRHEMEVPPATQRVVLILEHQRQNDRHHLAISPSFLLNGKRVGRLHLDQSRQFAFAFEVSGLRGTRCRLEIRTPQYFIPKFVHSNCDDRKLSLLLHEIRLE